MHELLPKQPGNYRVRLTGTNSGYGCGTLRRVFFVWLSRGWSEVVQSAFRMLGLLIAAHHENLTITISTLALALSFVSLGWNIYRDIILKPRLRVRFGVSQFLFPDNSVTPHFLKLSVVNLGPGDARVVAARARTRPFFLGWFDKERLSTVIHNYNDPFSPNYPQK